MNAVRGRIFSPAVLGAIRATVVSKIFQDFIIGLIVINAVIIGMETYPFFMSSYARDFHIADRLILWVFTVEIMLRFIAARSNKEFFADGWHWFDISVVAAGYAHGSQFLTVVRLFRILRVLRAITVIPGLQKLVGAILKSLPPLSNILILLSLLFYVYGTAGTFLYREIAPEYFGSLHISALTLFEIMTLENWTDIMHKIRAAAPGCWLFFVSFILLGTYITLNFFVGVIVANVQHLGGDDEFAKIQASLERLEARFRKNNSREK